MRRTSRRIRVLDFDCESRPLGWLGSDYVHQEITVIAWKWIGEPGPVEVRTLTKDDRSRLSMLRAFRKAYAEADMVAGHYIRNYDLPLVNAMLVELGEPSLGFKLSSDTKNDLPPMKGISKSQGSPATSKSPSSDEGDFEVAGEPCGNVRDSGAEDPHERPPLAESQPVDQRRY